MEIIFYEVLILNFLGSIVYGIIRKVKGNGWSNALFFIFLPVLGFLLYFIPRFLFDFMRNEQYDRESLVKRFIYTKSQEFPSMEKELDVVPILDAMAISKNDEKRELLLEELKKDLSTNYKVLLPAAKDTDSETAHYIAAAKMEVYRDMQEKWMKAWKNWTIDKEEDSFHNVFSSLEKLISSELLSYKEEILYKEKYIKLFFEEEHNNNQFISENEVTCSLVYLIDLKQYEEAEHFYHLHINKCRNETAYCKILQMYYEARRKEKFYEILNQLRMDKEVRLSQEGLNSLRFWLKKEK